MKGLSVFMWIRSTPIIPVLITVFLELASSYIVKRDTTPYFKPTPSNITVHEGDLAVLKCHIGNLGPKMVNVVVWRKIGQDVPLTIGKMRFAPEATEFTIDHDKISSSSSTWDLLIKNVQSKHAGVYECQVTANHRIAQNVNLNVLERSKLRSELRMGGTEYVDMGNQIHLTCNATGEGRTQVEVDWFFEGNRIHPSNPRWEGRLEILKRRYDDNIYVSELIIDRSTMDDKGSYVCRSSDLMVSSLKIHVLKDGHSKVTKKGGVIASKVRKELFIKSSSNNNPGRRETSDEGQKGEMRKAENAANQNSFKGLLHILTLIVLVYLTR